MCRSIGTGSSRSGRREQRIKNGPDPAPTTIRARRPRLDGWATSFPPPYFRQRGKKNHSLNCWPGFIFSLLHPYCSYRGHRARSRSRRGCLGSCARRSSRRFGLSPDRGELRSAWKSARRMAANDGRNAAAVVSRSQGRPRSSRPVATSATGVADVFFSQ